MDPPDSPPARKIRQRTASDDAKKKDREARSIAIEKGGFQLEFVSISRVINHMTCYNSIALIGGKLKKKSFTRFALQFECCYCNQ